MKRFILVLLLCIGLIFGIEYIKAQTYPGNGDELTASVPIDGLIITSGEENITVRSDQSTNLDDYEGKIEYAQATVKINVNVPTGTTLKSGDYFSIPMTKFFTGTWPDLAFITTDWDDLKDNNNVTIGQWRVINPNNQTGTIQVVLNENVNGKNSLPQISVTTGSKGIHATPSTQERVGKVQIDGKIFTFKVKGTSIKKITTDAKWQSGGTSNYRIYWGIRVGTSLTDQIWNSRGEEGELVDTIVEDSFEGAESITFDAKKSIYLPISVDKSKEGVSEKSFANVSIKNAFTQITPNDGETYEDFKARVITAPMQYGIYTDSDETPHIIIYCGKLGVDTPVYTENNITTAANNFIKNELYDQTDFDALTGELTNAFINGKTNGHATAIRFYIMAYYPKTNVERSIENTAHITYDGVDSTVTKKGTLSTTSAIGELTSARVKIVKKEKNTNRVLQGAKIKLQFRDSDNEWIDYTSPATGLIDHETNENGEVSFENLPVGTFRVVESEAPVGYDKEDVNEQFEIVQGSDLDTTIELYNTKHTYHVVTHHYKQGTTETIDEDVTQNKYYGDGYTTSVSANIPEGYELVGTPTNASGTIEGSDIIVIYEYKLKDVVLTIKHVDEEGNSLASDEIVNYKYGNEYTSAPSENIPDNYELLTAPTNASGTIKQDTTITYIYKIKPDPVPPIGRIIVKYVDINGNEIEEDITTSKEIGNTYTSQPKEIEGYILKQKPESEEFTYTEQEQVVTYIYERIKLKIETKVNGAGGTIEGDEEVLYGEDSTKDKIVIKALRGYTISRVTINGSVIAIPENSENLTISNFIKMTDDKLIEVTFKEKEPEKTKQVVKVPSTDKSAIIFTTIGAICVVAALLVYYFKLRKKN